MIARNGGAFSAPTLSTLLRARRGPRRVGRMSEPVRGRVTVSHGRLLRVRLEDGSEALLRAAGRDLSAVCGDRVCCELDPRRQELRVTAVEPRGGALYRSNARGGAEPIAANLTLLIIVIAPLPEPDLFIVDRYLAAAHCAGIRPALLLNKQELALSSELERELLGFEAAGCARLAVSALRRTGLDALRALLRTERAMLVGQSGVGKSSLLGTLLPDSGAAIGELLRDCEGRHTTTTTRLYELPEGGELIDSPGVRDFAPALEHLEPRALGFAEIEALAPQCRFADCQHLREPDCAVRAAVGTALSARRYESYRRLRRLYERLRAPTRD